MAHLERFNNLVKSFGHKVDFLIVYVEEAHPTDGWVFYGNEYEISTHKSLEERLFAAAMLARAGVKCPLVVDTFTDEAEKAYSALPERIYLIEDGMITFTSGKGPVGYAVAMKQVEEMLKNRFNNFGNKGELIFVHPSKYDGI